MVMFMEVVLLWEVDETATKKKLAWHNPWDFFFVLCPSRNSAWLGLAPAFGQKSPAGLAMPFKKLGLACYVYLAKKLGSVQLALSFKKTDLP